MNEEQRSLLLKTSSRFPPPQGQPYLQSKTHFFFSSFHVILEMFTFMFLFDVLMIFRSEALLWHCWVQSGRVDSGIHGVQSWDIGGSEVAQDQIGDWGDDHCFPQQGL